MDQILSYLQALPEADFIKSICLLIFTSCSGLIPNNNDISLAAAGLITRFKNLSPFQMASATTLSWMAGETTVFFLGRTFGRKILKLKFISKKMNEERQIKIAHMINQNPFSLFIMIRLTPVLRACSILTIGSLGLSPLHFITKHLPLLALYAISIFYFFYYGGQLMKNIFAENAIIVMSLVIIAWLTMMVLIGRKFIKKLN